MNKLLYSLGVVIIGLLTGYVFRLLIDCKLIKPSRSIDEIRKRIQMISLLVLNPIAFVGSIWVLEWRHIQIAALPFIGATALALGGVAALFGAKLLKLNRYQTGAFFVCGSFTNIGSIGALVCYFFFGEPGFALVSFYKLFEEFLYYSIGFPIAKSFSAASKDDHTLFERLKTILTDVFVLVALGSIVLGFLLNITGLPRPEFYQTVNLIVIPLSSFFLLASIGMAIRLQRIRSYLGAGLVVAMIKFIIVPFVAIGLGFLLGLGRVNNGLPLRVVAILSSMPVGFIAMVPPTIYELDVDLANTCWIVTTALLVLLVLPLQYSLLL